MMKTKKRDEASQSAKELLARHGLSAPPVPIFQLAEKLGIEVVPDHLEPDVSGMLYRGQGRAIILVNKLNAPIRQRFTVAHEIGHFVLHPGDAFVDFRDTRSSTGLDRHEREANRFAADLLMPEEWVYEAFKEVVLEAKPRASTDDSILMLAKRFDVSAEAMRFRLVNLGVLSGT
jgi:Zn-dependent peptidase ImmA (M78 family)